MTSPGRKTSKPTRRLGKPDETRADRAIRWIQDRCVIPEGRDVGKRVVLRPWQRDILRMIYDNPHGTRRAIVSMGRKNAKTGLSAFLLLLHLCGPEAKANSELYSTAMSREQAAKLYDMAAKIVRLSPKLRPFVLPKETAKELICPGKGTRYKALSAEASTAYGFSPAFTVHDELGQVKGPRSSLYDALETAVGAHEDPLSIIISTQAPTDADALSVLIDDARSGEDPRVVLVLYSADIEADPFSEETIREANPAFGDFLNAKEVLAMAEDARRMPSREAEYRNLILNQRVEASNPFISRGLWTSCIGDVTDFDGLPVYGGLDLSATADLTALVLIAPFQMKWHVRPTFWLPGEGLREKSQKDRVPYDQWAREGFLQTTPGRSIEYEFVAEYLRGLFDELDIRQLAFDRWGFKHLRPWLLKAGFSEEEIESRFVEFGQGMQSMSPALRALESAILEGRLVHDGHPVLTMCMGNAVVQTDPAGNRKLAKNKSRGRIDGAVALAMAMGVAGSHIEEEPMNLDEWLANPVMV